MGKPSKLTDSQADSIVAVVVILVIAAAVVFWVAGA